MTAVPVGAGRQLARGLAGRCARCGSRGLFPAWFRMREACPRCGLRFEREPGYWIGAVAVNLALVGTLFVAVLVTGLALTVPDVPVARLLAVTVPIVALGPLLLWRVSRTLWVAVDRALLQRLDARERPDERYGRR